MKHRNIQQVEITSDRCEVLRFRLNGGWDYAWVTFDDRRGHIAISSSFGNYAFIWSAMGEGVTLKTFFARAQPDYLAEKLFSDRHEQISVFDATKAIEDMKKDLFQQRRDGTMNADQARGIYDELVDLSSDAEGMSSDLLGERFYRSEELTGWMPDYYDYAEAKFGYEESSKYRVLRDEIIPMIQAAFKGALSETTHSVAGST